MDINEVKGMLCCHDRRNPNHRLLTVIWDGECTDCGKCATDRHKLAVEVLRLQDIIHSRYVVLD